ncbi:N-acetylmuramoyl-L-alanine amidase [Peptostreptococcus equinus]|uniref:N-acetylmuramoyl-L-alanine amidase n=1 Tax=Peptostreptococcus equinus TaxID=3003601 RepID=A0ABY7JQ94_9FIRM|nr:N-acetylmuramoyl-L-alanine amidase [Peptostreptococcus sp. CBA3647]WAW15519.1 N-acetylmuramoyl-L-alanine amidase [Peptostreptococcus sp. CBA3647]
MKKCNIKLKSLIISLLISTSMLSTSFAQDNKAVNDVTIDAKQVENLVINDNSGQVNVELGVGKVNTSSNTQNSKDLVIDKSNIDLNNQDNNLNSVNDIKTSNLKVNDMTSNYSQKTAYLSQKIYGMDRYETAAKVSKQGWPNGSSTVVIVNGNNTINGLLATPLASTFNSPILLSNNNGISSYTMTELKRLKPSKIYLIGNISSIPQTVADSIKSITGASINRISAGGSSELSATVAEIIRKNHSVSTSYVVSEYNGMADALSIASKAGETKNPILITDNIFISDKALQFARSMQNVYYIGGESSMSNSIIDKISPYVNNGSRLNRIFGVDRHATNVKVIDKFYPNVKMDKVVVTRSDNAGLIDTVSAGPYASLIKAPILITNSSYISKYTKDLINVRTANIVYQIGGGISASIIETIVNRLSILNYKSPVDGKVIVIDPGHGGKDSGASGLDGQEEKDWNLVTALSCAQYLRDAGADVVLTRTNDYYPSLQERADISNTNPTVLFCSIHYNSAESSYANGVEVYKGEGNLASRAATNVLNNILGAFDLSQRAEGVKENPGYYVINNTTAPAILVEGGFMSNRHDVDILKYESAQKTMGIQIAKGIIETFR